MRLAKRDPAVDQLRRPSHDEQAFAVLFDFRPLMGIVGVFDGEIVQVELFLHTGQERQIRLIEPDPDHVTGLAAPARRLIDGNIGDAPAVDINAGGDNAFGGDRIGRGGRLRYNIHGFNPEMLLSPAPTQHFDDASTGKTPVNWLSLPRWRSAADSRFPAGTANEI